MTNEKTLEERTASTLRSVEDLMEDAGSREGARATYLHTLAIYEQNRIIIDYLSEIYKNQKGWSLIFGAGSGGKK